MSMLNDRNVHISNNEGWPKRKFDWLFDIVLVILLMLMIFGATKVKAQPPITRSYVSADTVLTDSTPVLSIRHINAYLYYLQSKISDKITLKEWQDLQNAIDKLIDQADKERKQKMIPTTGKLK